MQQIKLSECVHSYIGHAASSPGRRERAFLSLSHMISSIPRYPFMIFIMHEAKMIEV